jgi:hypothetical protein
MARSLEYTQEIADSICERLIDGQSLRTICLDEAMPSASTVCRWLTLVPKFSEQYAHAREAQADTLADEILDIADDGSNDWMVRDGKLEYNGDHVQRSRLRVDSRKWIASKLKAKKYGDKTETTHVGDKERPIVITPPDAAL